MIYGIGVDIVEVVRIKRAYERWGQRFANKILGVTELQHFTKTRNPVRFLSMRFAAKEAVSKAFGTGFKQGVSPRQIEVVHQASGKPSVIFSHHVAKLAEQEHISASFITMADEREYAVAYAILEYQSDPK
ncbi:MAG: holo-[acyl-carrier protein] synthase [Gammaproteobacteria bacterium]|jgi:holo-[acyl-carrier protein] synthase